ncbi:hypothetical protein [Aquimarina litoralis]|uniref:hypothetical protein n=1 Tax=Aquimarina litoralis TaxID=584605 RepID=UPI001C599B73|nr:hypothetical protein [Aquimarina litoralis]MBW1299035.1 hypothetical protein [Aquimarina litoralis]
MKRLLIILFIITINVYSQQNTSEIPPSKLNSENQSLDKVFGYTTLTMTAYIADLGEFGGHKETIVIKRREDKILEATIIEYNKICHSCEKKEELKIVKQETFPVKKQDEQIILNYLNKLFLESFNNHVIGHGSNRYSATMESNVKLAELELKETHFSIQFEDSTEWKAFKELKKNITYPK